MGDVELVDTTSCSAAQLVTELIFNTKLKMPLHVAENLFCGIVSDSDRFLLPYTTAKTFKLVSRLIEETNLDFSKLYVKLYERPLNEIRFQGYLAENLILTENGFAYIELIEKFGVDSGTASNMVNNFNFIKEVKAWAFISYDTKNKVYKVNIRSRGPVINEIAAKYNGGGHALASGAKLNSIEMLPKLIEDLKELINE